MSALLLLARMQREALVLRLLASSATSSRAVPRLLAFTGLWTQEGLKFIFANSEKM